MVLEDLSSQEKTSFHASCFFDPPIGWTQSSLRFLFCFVYLCTPSCQHLPVERLSFSPPYLCTRATTSMLEMSNWGKCYIWSDHQVLCESLNLFWKMVFASRGETVSGGNFHGEYPAKVSFSELLLTLKAYSNIGQLNWDTLSGPGLFGHWRPWTCCN